MNERLSELDQAKAALDQARLDHAAAMLARHDDPTNPETRRWVNSTVQQGKIAWKAY